MSPVEHGSPPSQAHRSRRAIVFVDIVESVRLIQDFEDDVIDRWRRFVHEVRSELLPAVGGRMVKSVGDGMLLDFQEVPAAAQASREILRRIRRYNHDRAPEAQLHLRLGAHIADVVVEDFDILGKGVNVAARLLTLARPSELIASAEFRAGLLQGLDGDIEDLGECYLKHLAEPVRAFRVNLEPSSAFAAPIRSFDALARPLILVAPLVAERSDAQATALCAALSDDLVQALSRSDHWSVLSRLTTAALAGRSLSDLQMATTVGARYLVRGSLQGSGVTMEVIDTRSGDVVGAGHSAIRRESCLSVGSGWTGPLVLAISTAVLQRELQIAHEAALPNLPSYTLLLHAVSRLHSMARDDVLRAKESLDHVVARHPRSSEAHAWTANWHFVQIAQVAAYSPLGDAAIARSHLARALDEQPEHALSLALEGHLCSYVDGNSEDAERLLRRAVELGPNESLGWLFLANLLTHSNRGEEAVAAVNRASLLSPYDPLGYLQDLVAAGAFSAAGLHAEALEHAQKAVRANALHLTSWVQLIIAQVQCGRFDDARASARHYLTMRPGASVARFLEWHPARGTPLARSDADALLAAGIPM